MSAETVNNEPKKKLKVCPETVLGLKRRKMNDLSFVFYPLSFILYPLFYLSYI